MQMNTEYLLLHSLLEGYEKHLGVVFSFYQIENRILFEIREKDLPVTKYIFYLIPSHVLNYGNKVPMLAVEITKESNLRQEVINACHKFLAQIYKTDYKAITINEFNNGEFGRANWTNI